MPWTATHPALFIGLVTIVLSGLAWFMIYAHRTHLHRRLPWPLIAPYLALKWALIGMGAYCLVGLYVIRLGWIGATIFFVAPFLYGWRQGLRIRPPGPES